MSIAETRNRYLEGNYAPVQEEVTAFDLPVIGALPAELNGRYLRNGPNPVTAPDPASYHWFTGDGMVHGIRLRDGKAEWYRNRWVRSARVAEALGEAEPEGEVHGGMDSANTNVIGHAGRTFAIVEAGARPVELTYELDTLCRTDLEGTLPNGYTAHPKRDPETDELFAVSYHWALPGLQYTVIDADGRVRKLETIAVDDGPMVHDMSITATRAVFYDLPVTFDLDTAMSSRFPYVWNERHPARVGVMPREGTAGDVRWFDVEPCYVFHPLNAYDDGDRVVLDVVRHPRMFATDMQGPNEGAPTLWRWTVDPSAGVVKEEQLDDTPIEFPRVDERVVGRPHRYGWAATLDDGDDLGFDGNRIARYDLTTGASATHDFGPGRSAGEAVFVPAREGAAEDDGWLMSLVHDAATDRSELVLLPAADPSAEPVARVELPARVPLGFHGNWVPDD
jgi:carotenoid cleavage dioxygenase